MDLPTALAALLIKYHATRVPEHLRGESESSRVDRITLIATQTDEACRLEPFSARLGWNHIRCVTALATVIKWESGLLRETHSGEKVGPAGEVCLAQLHRSATQIPIPRYVVTEAELAASVGLDPEATLMCLRLGARILGHHIARMGLWYEDGYWQATRVFDEYHRPTVFSPHTGIPIGRMPSSMSTKRGMSFQMLLRQLSKATKP